VVAHSGQVRQPCAWCLWSRQQEIALVQFHASHASMRVGHPSFLLVPRGGTPCFHGAGCLVPVHGCCM